MKILIVCSGNRRPPGMPIEMHQPFVFEQAEALRRECGIHYEFFLIEGQGYWGYWRNLHRLKERLKSGKVDLVHAHYGLSGLLAVGQRKIPVVVTFHGSDIDLRRERALSKIAMRLSAYNIFVTERLAETANAKTKFSVVPCGIDVDRFFCIERVEARRAMKLDPDQKLVLFAGSFDNPIKNYPLAKAALDRLSGVKLVQLKGYTRSQVNLLMNACDALLVTSLHESGPLVVKEALACGLPIVTTNVGDVKVMIDDIDGCYVVAYQPDDIAEKLGRAIAIRGRTTGRKKIVLFDNKIIAKEIFKVYTKVLGKN